MPDERTVPGICRAFNAPNEGCTRGGCQLLHICFYFATDKCRFGDNCKRPHRLTTVHNKAVLRDNGWHHENQHPKILKLLEEEFNPRENNNRMTAKQNKQEPKQKEHVPKRKEKSVQEPKEKQGHLKQQQKEKIKLKREAIPATCNAYNKNGCNKVSCPFLHVCFGYVMGSCDKKGKCLKEHNIFKGEQNIEVLSKFNLLSAKDVFTTIREGYEARAAAKAAAIEASDGACGGATRPPSSVSRSRSAPPASLTCSVCCEPFIRATTLGCTHTFCEDCVRRTERQGQPCPLCRAPISTAVRSLVIDDTVADWFDGQDEQTQRARRRLETDRRRAAAVPQPLKAAPGARPKANPAPKANKPPGGGQHQRSKSRGRGAKTMVRMSASGVVTTTVYH